MYRKLLSTFVAPFVVVNKIIARQCRRLFILEDLVNAPHTQNPEQNSDLSKIVENMICMANLPIDQVLNKYNSSLYGLNIQQVHDIQNNIGLNIIQQEKPFPWYQHLWECYANPFNFLLTLVATISYLTSDFLAAFIIFATIVTATLLQLVQEVRANTAAEKLKKMVSNMATVLRQKTTGPIPLNNSENLDVFHCFHPDNRSELAIQELVPGDIILLAAGDMLPADVRILYAKDLFINQSSITGESFPVEKFAAPTLDNNCAIFDLSNICLMGTNVVSGSAIAIVIATAEKTYFGMLADKLNLSPPPSSFEIGINDLSSLLIRIISIVAPIIFLLNGALKGEWVNAALFTLSIAVGLTPEMLPMVVTSALAKAAITLSRKKVIIKRLSVIQSLGSMDILCTDKTGTLTQDKIFLERYTDAFGLHSERVLEYAFLNSYYQTGLKNLLDVAVLEHKEVQQHLGLLTNYRKVDEIPFDFHRRRMSVVVNHNREGNFLICKGALEEILSICCTLYVDNKIEPLTEDLLFRIRTVTSKLNSEGLRIVAVAVAQFPRDKQNYSIHDESQLTLIGYIAFLDPPKESTKPALRALASSGVSVKILTGDNDLVTKNICHEVGISANNILQGVDIDAMNDEQLKEVVHQINVFTKLTPIHKERIVKSLRSKNYTVGFMGDGINDAAALRAADIGISVDSAVDIAKEAADVILLEKSLMVLEEAVLEGRKTFVNMMKYIKAVASANFGNIFSVLIAGAFLPFLPMLPLHLLIQNLIYDIASAALPFDNVDEEVVKYPLGWEKRDLLRSMFFLGPISSIFDIVTFLVLWFLFSGNSVENQIIFHSGWFLEGLISQLLVIHLIRTDKIPFLQSQASWIVILSTICAIILGLLLTQSCISSYFKLQAMPLSYFPILGLILISYIAIFQIMKQRI